MKLYPPHPLAELFPEMPEAEYAELVEDIRRNGLREAIRLVNNQFVLDGRHRQKACLDAGIEPHYTGIRGSDQELLAYVISTNLRRRHLSESQRGMIAATLENMPLHRPANKDANLHTSRADAANMLGVSPRTVADASKVRANGARAVVRAVEQGRVAVSTAAAIADVPKAEQRAILSFSAKEITARAKEIKAEKKADAAAKTKKELELAAASFTLEYVALRGVEIFNMDSRSLASCVSPDVDLVFTSPPFNVGIKYATHDDSMPDAAYTALLRDVFAQCFLVMREGARIGVNVPFGVNRDPYLPFAPRIFALLTECGFTLIGQTVWDKGPQKTAASTAWGSYGSPSAPRFRDRCEIIVWAYKNSPALEIPEGANALIDGDTFRLLSQDYWLVSPASSKRHPAVFPVALAENAIRFFGYEGCHVLDPFMGLGATLVAAEKLGCRGTGFEIDKAYCRFAERRLRKK